MPCSTSRWDADARLLGKKDLRDAVGCQGLMIALFSAGLRQFEESPAAQ
jgi:hypothetical protein